MAILPPRRFVWVDHAVAIEELGFIDGHHLRLSAVSPVPVLPGRIPIRGIWFATGKPLPIWEWLHPDDLMQKDVRPNLASVFEFPGDLVHTDFPIVPVIVPADSELRPNDPIDGRCRRGTSWSHENVRQTQSGAAQLPSTSKSRPATTASREMLVWKWRLVSLFVDPGINGVGLACREALVWPLCPPPSRSCPLPSLNLFQYVSGCVNCVGKPRRLRHTSLSAQIDVAIEVITERCIDVAIVIDKDVRQI